MPKDIIVVTKIDAKPRGSEALDILLISTEAEKPLKTYRSLEEIEADFGGTAISKKAEAMFNQPHTLADTLIRKVKIMGVAPPESPAALLASIEALREKNDDWYILLTDRTEDEYIKALAAWAERTEPTEAEMGAGVEDHRKLYFYQTSNLELAVTNARCIPVYTNNLDEHADGAYLGNVGPHYPKSVTWKFKRPDGMTLPDLTSAQRDALEEANVNFLTAEYKHEYIKNGVCANGEFIDVQMGADYITQYMREELYQVSLKNAKVPYTDEGFALTAAAVFAALNRAVALGIVTRNPESGKGVFTVKVPKRSEASDDDARGRHMPPIVWEAQLEGAVHSVKITGTLKATLSA